MLKRIKLLFPKKGSVLIFSLIILAFMLVSALSLATVSVTEKRASFSTERSSRSFQVADSGVEIILQKIYKGSYSDLNLLAAAAGGSCTSGVISDSLNSGSYKVFFYKNDGTQIIDCGSITWRDDVVKIKSEGASGNTTRAVEVAVAAAVSVAQGSLNGYCMNNWGGQQCDTGSAISPATCGGAGVGCQCPVGYTKIVTGTCNFGDCVDSAKSLWNTAGSEIYFYTCSKN